MKIRMVCVQVMSFIYGRESQPWSLGCGENQPPEGIRHQVSFEMANPDAGHGSITVQVADEYELAKWVPGHEYDVEIGVEAESSPLESESVQCVPPEGFIIQDRVPVRVGIDRFRWSHWPDKGHWTLATKDNFYLHGGGSHGYRPTYVDDTLSVCCRPSEYPVELNDDGIVGMYSDPPQPIESAGGGVQQYEPPKVYPPVSTGQVTVTVDDNLNVVKTETSGPTIEERVNASDLYPDW